MLAAKWRPDEFVSAFLGANQLRRSLRIPVHDVGIGDVAKARLRPASAPLPKCCRNCAPLTRFAMASRKRRFFVKLVLK